LIQDDFVTTIHSTIALALPDEIPTRSEAQENPMKHIVSYVGAAGLVAVALCGIAHAQTRGAASSQSASSTPSDFTEGNLKFHRTTNGFMQVVDTTKNENAGTVIFPPGGAPVFAPMPGYDIKSAYEKHMNGGASAAQPANASKEATPATSAAPTTTASATTATAPAASFDAASKTVTLSEGRAVTFTDNDNLKVQMPGPAGTKTYDLHFHKASAGGAMKEWAHREQGRVGGSLGGGGVTISLESQNGMPGGEVYDTAGGAAFGNSGLAQAKVVIAAVREATDIAKSKGATDLANLNVVKSLLSNNLGM
jgi:hypothetical protein